MTKIIFIHGWGFDQSFWNDVRAEFTEVQTSCLDMGFFGNENIQVEEGAIYVTHSMGMAWLLKQTTEIKGLVVINGFTQFCSPEGVSERVLQRMIRQFKRSPELVWTEFLKNCGVEKPTFPADADTDKLTDALTQLLKINVTEQFETLFCPKMILASENDAIVLEKMTRSSFPNDVIWYKDGQHVLPLTETISVVQHIREFLGRLGE